MPYNRGDVELVLFPNSDLRTAKFKGHLLFGKAGAGGQFWVPAFWPVGSESGCPSNPNKILSFI